MKVLLYPDSRLIAKNEPIAIYTPEIAEKISEMFTLMYQDKGIGLSAPQVGWNVNLFVINTTGKKEDEHVYFNPIITTFGNTIINMEGCLSFPGMIARIKRPEQVKISADTPSGHVEEEHSGLISQAIQHEYDHTIGILFIERMTPADLRRNNPILQRLKSTKQD